MKKGFLKRGIVLLLVIAMAFSVVACGKKNNEAERQKMTEADKDSVYTYEVLSWDEETSENMGGLQIGDNMMYGTIYEYDEETYESVSYFVMFDLQGKEITRFMVPSGWDDTSSYGYNQFTVANENEIYGIKYEYTNEFDEITGGGSWNEFYSLVKFDKQGNEVWQVSIGSSGEGQDIEGEYYSLQNLTCDNNGNVWTFDNAFYTCYDKDGNKVCAVEALENFSGNVWLTADNTFIVGKWDDEWTTVEFFELDAQKGTIAASNKELPGSYYQYSYYSGADSQWDMYATNSIGVWAFNWGDKEMTKIMDYMLSDFDGTNIYNVTPVSETKFVASYYDTDWNYQFATFTKVPKEEVVDKYIINLACYYVDEAVRKQIIEFNRSHKDVRIMLTDYATLDSEENNWSGGMDSLNADILEGKVPDIFIAPSDFDMGIYANKGLFTDLYALIEQDETIKLEDYLENIIALGEYDGKLYELIPRFNAVTMIGKASEVGDKYNWTYDEVNALMAQKGDEVNLLTTDNTRYSVMSAGLNLAFDQFYDPNTGECHFDSKEFEQFLELVKEFPEEISDDYYNDEMFWVNYENQWRNGETVLKYEWVYDFMNYVENSQGYFGEKISYVGFPTTEGSGSAAYAGFSLAISEESPFKKEAWEFVSHFIMDDYQESITDEFPVKLSALDKKAEEDMKPDTWVDPETGEEIIENPTFWVGEEEITLNLPTEEECEYVKNFLKNIDYRQRTNDDIRAIIDEDTAAYFEGEKSAKQVADTIQSRVKIYINEKR